MELRGFHSWLAAGIFYLYRFRSGGFIWCWRAVERATWWPGRWYRRTLLCSWGSIACAWRWGVLLGVDPSVSNNERINIDRKECNVVKVDYMMDRHESLGPEWARHILHHIVYIFELFGHIIWKLYFELLLNTHQKLHCIQLVQPQLVPLTIQCDFFRVIYFIVLGNYSHHPSGGFVGVQVVPWVILILPLASSLILICVLSISWCPPPKPNMGCTNNLLNAVIFLLFLKMFIIDTDLLYIIIKLNYDSNPRSKGGV